MTVASKPRRSRVVQAVGVGVILIGVVAAESFYRSPYALWQMSGSDLHRLAVSFAIAAISFGVIGIGILLHKRWALMGWLALTGIGLAMSLVQLVTRLASPIVPAELSLEAVRMVGNGLVMGIPAYLLWKRRDFFARETGGYRL